MIFRIKLTANGAAATLRLDYEGSEKKHQCIPFIQKDNQNTETGSTVNLSSLFYGKDVAEEDAMKLAEELEEAYPEYLRPAAQQRAMSRSPQLPSSPPPSDSLKAEHTNPVCTGGSELQSLHYLTPTLAIWDRE